jgi:pyruvate/2-oxoglutarate dehydrogenase complex dihydrolipoamide dehydrogenase (E3) component
MTTSSSDSQNSSTPDELDRVLDANVRPAEWQNPVPHERYNLVVIGGGPAGLITSIAAAGLGARVALVERDRLGGDCLNVGCVPSKSLLRAAKAAAAIRSARRFGVSADGPPRVEFDAVMHHVRQARALLSRHDAAARYRDLGVDVFFGEGAFLDQTSFGIGGQHLKFARAVICTGARARVPVIRGLAEAGFLTNESVFSLQELPRRLTVLGGGPIGCELAQAFARLGSQVTLFDTGPRLLPRDDEVAVRLVQAQLDSDGVRLHCESQVTQIEPRGATKLVHFDNRSGGGSLETDAILVATGRLPNTAGLGLEQAGVRFDPQTGVAVDDFLRTSNRNIFAAGDVCSAWRFTHAADAMARIVVRNALFPGKTRVSRLLIPWCTYTDPELAQVGLTELEAHRKNIPLSTFEVNLAELDRGVVDGLATGLVRVHMVPDKDRILGATVVGPHAGDLISQISLAMTNRLGLAAFAQTIVPYPSLAEAFKRAADARNRTRLTPWVQSVLRRWFAWTR